jgi:acyl-CoA synthetase (AMP-forming)/AMP-acid ligase II
MVKIRGLSVFPSEVERLMRHFGGVQDVHVFGRESPLEGSILCANVRFREGRDLTPALTDWCRANMTRYKIPRFVNPLSN